MLFYPVRFAGVRFPGLARLAHLLPRRVQQVPGVMKGGVGWQGIIPSRAAKMGSIAVDKGIAKIGSPRDFYEQLEPDQIAEQILASVARRHPRGRRADDASASTRGSGTTCPSASATPSTHGSSSSSPRSCTSSPTQIGEHIDQLLDVKLMVIRHIEANPELGNRIFLEVGRRELRLIINFGFLFGFLLGIPLVFITHALPVLVGAADRRRDHRLRHQLGRALDDLRADRAAAARAAEAPGALPAPPAGGGRGLRARSSPTTSSPPPTSATSC